MASRVSEKVFLDIFTSIPGKGNRIPLKTALNRLNSFFNSPENPYKKYLGEDSSANTISSEQFMDEFYSRNVDKRHGLRSQILMVGGPKNIRGNPRGPMDAMLSFPQITFEQFYGIAKDMECMFLEKIIPGSCGTKLTRSYTTKQLEKLQKRENGRILKTLKTLE